MILVVCITGPETGRTCQLIFLIPVDCGDYVVVTNSRKIKVTGRKDQQLLYRKHSMYPGGLKETPYRDMMAKKPDEARPLADVVPVVYLQLSPDYTARSLGHVTQKQTSRAPTGETSHLSSIPHGNTWRECSQKLGRWDATSRFRPNETYDDHESPTELEKPQTIISWSIAQFKFFLLCSVAVLPASRFTRIYKQDSGL